LGLELRKRAHQVTVASTEAYGRKVEANELSFRALRPNWDPTDQELIRRFEDLLPACREADQMIAGDCSAVGSGEGRTALGIFDSLTLIFLFFL